MRRPSVSNGFAHCKRVIASINKHYGDKTLWMKSSELARYQAARELTKIEKSQSAITLTAPFAAPAYTLRFDAPTGTPRQITLKLQEHEQEQDHEQAGKGEGRQRGQAANCAKSFVTGDGG